MVYVHAYMLWARNQIKADQGYDSFLHIRFLFSDTDPVSRHLLHIPLFKTVHNFVITNQYMLCILTWNVFGRYLPDTIEGRITRELGAVLAQFHTRNYPEQISNISWRYCMLNLSPEHWRQWSCTLQVRNRGEKSEKKILSKNDNTLYHLRPRNNVLATSRTITFVRLKKHQEWNKEGVRDKCNQEHQEPSRAWSRGSNTDSTAKEAVSL